MSNLSDVGPKSRCKKKFFSDILPGTLWALFSVSQAGYELWRSQTCVKHHTFLIRRVYMSKMHNPVRSTRCGRPDRLGKNFFSAKKQGAYEATFDSVPGGVCALVWSHLCKPPYFLDLSCRYKYHAEPYPVCLMSQTGWAEEEFF